MCLILRPFGLFRSLRIDCRFLPDPVSFSRFPRSRFLPLGRLPAKRFAIIPHHPPFVNTSLNLFFTFFPLFLFWRTFRCFAFRIVRVFERIRLFSFPRVRFEGVRQEGIVGLSLLSGKAAGNPLSSFAGQQAIVQPSPMGGGGERPQCDNLIRQPCGLPPSP